MPTPDSTTTEPAQTILEPADRTIVAWFDGNDDLYAVYQRGDANGEPGDLQRWFNADQHSQSLDGPWTWPDLLEEMEGFRGPVELLPAARLRADTEKQDA